MTRFPPMLLERRIVPKIWGGRHLDAMLQTALEPVAEPIGETWEAYDRPDGSSAIRGGGTLRELLEQDAPAVLGEGVVRRSGDRFPLLLKLIDACDQLSVQVHPGAEQARVHGDGPKNEAWFVLAIGPNARIVRGFRDGVTREDVVRAARDGAAIEALLHSFTPRVGDVIRVPHGVVHAIGPDVVVFEVQQNSDLTFRLWDWGRPRELHVDAALEALSFAGGGAATVEPEVIDERSAWLLREPDFRVRRLRFDTPATIGTEGSFKLMSVLRGMAAVGWRSGGEEPPLQVQRGDTVLVPAVVDAAFVSPIGAFEVLWTDAGEAV